MKLSAAVITYNEEQNIVRFLKSVSSIADEIIVVDSFSQDKTKEIAENFPKVKFIQNRFEGYGPQKNFAIDHCSGEWILLLDADEIPDNRALQSIKKIVKNESGFFVYNIELINILLGRQLKYGGWGKVFRERLFKKGYGKYDDALVHETFLTESKKGLIEGKIHHYTYKSIAHHIEKINRYSTLMMDQYHKKNKRVNIFIILTSPAFNFFKNYFLRLGFLDGIVGFYAAAVNSFYTFLKYIKLYEKQNSF